MKTGVLASDWNWMREDPRRPSKAAWALVAGAVALLAGPVLVTAEEFQVPTLDYSLVLPADQDHVQRTIAVGSAARNTINAVLGEDGAPASTNRFTQDFRIELIDEGEGPIEIGFFVTGPPILFESMDPKEPEAIVPFSVLMEDLAPSYVREGIYAYREFVLGGRSWTQIIKAVLSLDLLDQDDFISNVVDDVTMTVVMQRVKQYCTMSANVTGDINGHYFGDVAYFNYHTMGVAEGMAGGSMGDRDGWKAVDALFGMDDPNSECESLIKFAEKFGGEIPAKCRSQAEDADDENSNPPPGGGGESFSDAMKREMAPEDGEGSDDFGLSLVDMKLEDRTRFAHDLSKTPFEKARVEGAGLEGLRALTGAGFTLNLSGSLAGSGIVEVSTLTVTAGAMTDVGAIKFQLADGGVHRVKLENVKDATGATASGYVVGTIYADLESEVRVAVPGITYSPEDVRTEDGRNPGLPSRKLKIHVAARFGAREGSMSCMR